LYLQNLNSGFKNKQKHAFKIMIDLLQTLLHKTKLSSEGPYEIESTLISLHEEYNCQFFIFDAIHNSNKLRYMYPLEYNNELMPIYLFEPLENKHHVMFIKNLNAYFKKNLKICFYCKKTFKNSASKHLCTKIKVFALSTNCFQSLQKETSLDWEPSHFHLFG
jgi:hypothetical protein